ncbi:MAG TPA: acetate--CoA ligase family protein, partial [Desertimonas sp.]|nr:acetate--CoA ligase family protein [Desertimonas sp.]
MTTLSERASKELLGAFGLPLARERAVRDADGAIAAAGELGVPVALKLSGDRIAHKTERGLVRLGIVDADAVREAADSLLGAVQPDDGDVELLVAPMIEGRRELIVGAVRDPQFGATVMLGIGGVLAEAIADVVFRPAPVDAAMAARM